MFLGSGLFLDDLGIFFVEAVFQCLFFFRAAFLSFFVFFPHDRDLLVIRSGSGGRLAPGAS